ncbi:HAD-IIA family hydrolase [Candidatus Bipolaricaulota bacterium]|nr:HAD-IIA family hydrolase [Candidatus Bipolaricaulota bacterium]
MASYTKLIVDLDGTLYRGQRPLPNVVETLERLRRTCSILFLSNNCNQSADNLAARLRELGFEAHPHEVVSSVTLMVQAVNEVGSGLRVLTLSSGDLDGALEEAGHRIVETKRVDAVVMGVDLGLSYDRLSLALQALLSGAILIGANADATYPTEAGPHPAAGAFVGAVRGMGFEPSRMCGKPDPWAMKKAFELRGFEPDGKCLLIGDRLDSDILGAQTLGISSALVLTGISTRSDIEELEHRPTHILRGFSELPQLLDSVASK